MINVFYPNINPVLLILVTNLILFFLHFMFKQLLALINYNLHIKIEK